MRKLGVLLLLVSAGCASAPIKKADELSLVQAQTRVLEGCYRCLIEARDVFERIAVGKARNILVDNGVNIRISPPTIVVGEDHNIFFPPKIPVFEVIFKTTMGRFMITLGLKEK